MRSASSPANAAHGRELLWFSIMTPSEQAACIHRLAGQGRDDYAIASVTKLSVEDVRRILSVSA